MRLTRFKIGKGSCLGTYIVPKYRDVWLYSPRGLLTPV